MARTVRSDACLAGTILGLGLLLFYVGTLLLDQWRSADHHNQVISIEDLIGFIANGAGAALVAWWILSFVLAFFASLLHRRGKKASANALAKFSPAFMLRIAAAVLSLNLLGATMAQASAPLPEPGWGPTAVNSRTSPHPAWTPKPAAGSAPDLQKTGSIAKANSLDPRWKPQPPLADPGLLSRSPIRQGIPPEESGVVVKSGDTLWSIAASRLGPLSTDVEVALLWPKWHAANRSVIGEDPSVLVPGQVLRPPLPG
ncbi:LysM peptidoglycan-binding domain-containing protein [Paenarthrobacter nicotinovorans]|uniref:LysM peptidoglycan-binding domain-containing protein n=1 Tax=Paenarthrobacter nicotinovorans TaxID=29320 RepID=A0ABV0GWA6_PAENI